MCEKNTVVDLIELCVSGEIHTFEALFDQKLLSILSPRAWIWEGESLASDPSTDFWKEIHIRKEEAVLNINTKK
jgi:hypothetical protein